MDAQDDNTDVQLYRASGELLIELKSKIPLLLRHGYSDHRGLVFGTKTDEVVSLVRPC